MRRTAILNSCCALAMLGCFAPSSSAQTAAHRITVKGVPNFGEVSPELYRGGQPTPEGFAELAKMGVAIVVDFRLRDVNRERKEVTEQGMQFVGLSWSCRHPTDHVVAQFLELLRVNQGKKVFFHCHYGVDRTGLAVAAYRMAEQGWTEQMAMREMRAFGFNVVHRTWCHALESYEHAFPERFRTDPIFNPVRPASPAAKR